MTTRRSCYGRAEPRRAEASSASGRFLHATRECAIWRRAPVPVVHQPSNLSFDRERALIRKPESTKKTSTPSQPPGRRSSWKSKMANTARPRSPSSAGMCGMPLRTLLSERFEVIDFAPAKSGRSAARGPTTCELGTRPCPRGSRESRRRTSFHPRPAWPPIAVKQFEELVATRVRGAIHSNLEIWRINVPGALRRQRGVVGWERCRVRRELPGAFRRPSRSSFH